MLKKLLIVVIVALTAFLILAALQPDNFRYERSTSINAPSDKVFEHINDLHKWEAWSPWAKLDPKMKSSFEGPKSGVGAVMKWEGNNEVGSGIMTITESKPGERIVMKLEFLKPMKGVNTAEFIFEPEGSVTNLTWAMYGECDFVCKAVSLIMNCEKMVSDMFDKGLANIKAIAEKESAVN